MLKLRPLTEGGPNQEGSGTIRTKQVLDREAKRTYHLPIIMSDSGVPSVTGGKEGGLEVLTSLMIW